MYDNNNPATSTSQQPPRGINYPPWQYGCSSEPPSGWIPEYDSSPTNTYQQQQPQQQQTQQQGWFPIPGQGGSTPSRSPGETFPPHPRSFPLEDPQQQQQQILNHSPVVTGNYPPPPPRPASQSNRSSNNTNTMNTAASGGTPEKASSARSGSTPSVPVKEEKKNSTSQPAKKKRKKSIVPSSGEADGPLTSPTVETDKEKEKRTKTGRACDACRTKKIRCDILPSPDSPEGQEEQPVCARCKQFALECTFFLPITETRFKKKRATDETTSVEPDPVSLAATSFKPKAGISPSDETQGVGGSSAARRQHSGRVEGPTSISFLLHTTIPSIPSEAYDLHHHNSWEVLEDGNGLIRVNAPPNAMGYADADPQDPTKAHNRLNKPILSGHTMSLLVNAYFNEIAPLFPIISRSEFAAKSSPSPLLLYSICGLGATRRQFPREVFSGVRGVINGLLRSNDILSDARFENVQALLLLAQVGDLHAQPTAATASASLIRTGAAIRMDYTENPLFELKPYKIWPMYGAALGTPLLVDLLDCDVLLPAPYNITAESEPNTWSIEPSFMALSEHLKLSILIGRVLKMIYSPTGLKHTTDAQLSGLVADMNSWKEHLPDELQFRGPTSPHVVGLLHMSYTGVQFLFWRVFMRITYSCPPHLSFAADIEQWSTMVKWSREALHWLDANDDALDTLFIFPYAATSCALVQYHTWARRGDPLALDTLKLIKETAMRWETTVQPDQMSIRRKTCETMTLLYEAALKTNPHSDVNESPSPLAPNPTAGVIPRKGGFSRLTFVKDDSRPGGGVFVAANESERMNSGLHPKDVILVSEMPGVAGSQVQGNGDIARVENGNTPVGGQGILRDLQWSGDNVNPQMNFESMGTSAPTGPQEPMPTFNNIGFGTGPHQQNINAHLNTNPNMFDPSFLDSLPVSTFDWESWSSYFDKFLPAANQSFETMQ
ncbi:hypothetical protein IAR55_004472 [Kwoniella newhampshirensis]|uniref:Zn(2)-C6 fungal-type domain-containing protein n=1 Tax=Kwoniella newhampshirensis TaxID=1651941 RepID=A0AAW0YX20_9TREE